MLKFLFIFLGTLSLILGVIGIVVPGLPTTPFLLLSAALYFKSSSKLYNWLIKHPVYGKFIRNYRETKSIPRSTKIYALSIMWVMISMSCIFFIKNYWVILIVFFVGIIGSVVMLRIPTRKS